MSAERPFIASIVFPALRFRFGLRMSRHVHHVVSMRSTWPKTSSGMAAWIAFLLAAIGAVMVLPLVFAFIGMSTPTERFLSIVRWPILLMVLIPWLAALYHYGPSRRSAKWRWVTWGSALAAVLWILTSMVFPWYVASFESYNRLYGSLGAGIGFMVWIWLSVVVILIGAELNAEMEHQARPSANWMAAVPISWKRSVSFRRGLRTSDQGFQLGLGHLQRQYLRWPPCSRQQSNLRWDWKRLIFGAEQRAQHHHLLRRARQVRSDGLAKKRTASPRPAHGSGPVRLSALPHQSEASPSPEPLRPPTVDSLITQQENLRWTKIA